ncbi:histidine kinase with PAS domain [Candidatus Halobonum tyrrellensis G22]|uniref:Histidine kinase with PAS domain n=1 Tax=Candidatus Halobonum tyrrellensis G22 TaxID=1324957 RepID=V4HP38_9EURY|nr:histidine kinase with PAS domain [Candidatus Halobonum tyrrellensis G22]
MPPVTPALWPVAGALVAALGSACLTRRLLAYRGKPGASWLALTLGSQAVFCGVSGVALLVADPGLRWLLESATWTALSCQVVAFLAFGLSYSGRGHLTETTAFRALYAYPVGTAVLLAVRPDLVWPTFRVERMMGLATVEYTSTGVGGTLVVAGLFLVALTTAMLLDTAVNYSLYRAESVAIALSAIPPAFAEAAWLLELGPYPQLNLVPIAFIPHLLADGYAVLRTDIFEYNPTTRRVVDATALESLESPLVVVNENRRVINLNTAACRVFGVTESAALKRPLDDVVGAAVDLDATDRTLATRVDGEIRQFAVAPSEHADATGTPVGYSVVFQDITAQRRREQRLDVLNRVLRHNIRNDLNVVQGNLGLAREAGADPVDGSADSGAAADGGRDARLATAERHTAELLALAEDARAVDALLDRTNAPREPVRLERAVAAGVDAFDGDLPVEVAVDGDAVVETDPALFETMVTRLLVAVDEHADGGVTVGLDGGRDGAETGSGGSYRLEFRAGTAFPADQVAAVEAGAETPLNHTTSLDIWMVAWGAELVGCELSFDGAATATLRIPVDGA